MATSPALPPQLRWTIRCAGRWACHFEFEFHAELPKITNPILAGVLAVLQTPWHEDETLDLETLEREIAWLFDCGANGIVMAMVGMAFSAAGSTLANFPVVEMRGSTP